MIEDFRLRVFAAVAEKGSFTLAAKALGISQPAVSQNVAELEKDLGKELFSRRRGAVSLTAAGRTFLEYADKILYWYSAAGEMFAGGKDIKERRVRIASDIFIKEYLLPDVLRSILSVNGSIVFEILPLDANEYDIFLNSHHSGQNLSIDDSAQILCSFGAAAVCADPDYSHADSLNQLPAGTRFAVWSSYSQHLLPDIASRVSLSSDSPSLVVRTVLQYPGIVGIVPRKAAGEGLAIIPAELDSLSFDVRISTSDSFRDVSFLNIFRSLF